MDMKSVSRQMVAQGSYGLYRINSHGQQIGHVITVWHAQRDHSRIGTFLTRAEARAALAAPIRTEEDVMREWAEKHEMGEE